MNPHFRQTECSHRIDRILPRRKAAMLFLPVLVLTVTGMAWAQAPDPANENRNLDARQDHNEGFQAPPSLTQNQALEALRAQFPALSARRDPVYGTTRSLFNRTGFLSGPSPQGSENAALAFARTHAEALGLTAADLANVVPTDFVFSSVSDVNHLYFRQSHQGLAVYGGELQVHLSARDNRVISVSNAFVSDIESAGRQAVADLSAAEAVASFASSYGLDFQGQPEVVATFGGPEQSTELSHPQISTEVIKAELMWLPIRAGDARIVWNFNVETPDGNHTFDVTVDAGSGAPWTRLDSTASDAYRVYARPLENPSEGPRTLEVDPADPQASPQPEAWHTSDLMDGNNVHAYSDADANNSPPGNEPSCGPERICDFPIDLGQDPTTYTAAVIANLFYWTNTIHDIQWQYGFDEAAGNFQDNNFGRGGLGNDSLNAEAQDGAGINNANMSTPSDGGRPRMQMFLWNNSNPRRDGDFDNGIIAHEYGHGISTRQVGGPNTNCLGGQQQPGEGWSDLMALIYTGKSDDQGGDARGVGAYASNSGGIRPQPYSTDSNINTVTYETLRSGVSIPHGVGWVWASIVWETYWNMIEDHGFGDLANAGGFGNQRAMLYINEGMKFTSCGGNTVDFLDARDGIIQAASQLNGGADVCRLWEGFAKRGLGINASTTGSNATATNGFDVPSECIPDVGPCIFTESFSGGSGNFGFFADPQVPAYTSGSASGGNVSVAVGGVDDANITFMLGSWDVVCELDSPTNVEITTVASLTQASDYEIDEVSEMRLTVNGNTEVLASFTGDGNGGVAQTTGLKTFTAEHSLPSGTSRISLGCFNNKKTFNNEQTDCVFDSVAVEEDPMPTTCLFTEFFGDGAGSFVFIDDPQDPAYTSGSASGGNVSVAVGGVDDVDITNMLGSWDRGCTLNSSTLVTFDVTASLTQAADYEANELSELRLTVNGNTNVLASLTGDGNGGDPQTSGLQTFRTEVVLPAGLSTISLGCFNNLKTFNSESTSCVFDAIAISKGGCAVEDFEGGAAGWSNDGASTCTAGAFVIGTPTLVVDGGVTTQVGGANSGVNALFTGVNTGAGTDDVDGGNCILTSPTFSISNASLLGIRYFHGQRDAGDDPGDDFFSLGVSTDGGASFQPIASNGDQTSNAAWTVALTSFPEGSDVVVRVECSDGAGPGDLVECGIDDVRICSE